MKTLLAIALVVITQGGLTRNAPPAPAATPTCGYCSGPPMPPTLVPTLPPAANPVQQSISVALEPAKVEPGHPIKITIADSANEDVTIVIAFHNGKTETLRGTTDGSGSYERVWKIPRKAAIGKAEMRVTVGTDVAAPVEFEVIHP